MRDFCFQASQNFERLYIYVRPNYLLSIDQTQDAVLKRRGGID